MKARNASCIKEEARRLLISLTQEGEFSLAKLTEKCIPDALSLFFY